MKVVVAKWQDSTTFGHWSSSNVVDESSLRICYAAGFLVTENSKLITIALLTSEDKEDFCSWINIPAGDVLELTVIKEVDWGVNNA